MQQAYWYACVIAMAQFLIEKTAIITNLVAN